MYTVTKYPPGCFCWADNSSTDRPASAAFYRDLLGWRLEEQSNEFASYTFCALRGAPVAIIAPLPPAMGIPSFWNSHVSVVSADESAARAAELGGQLIEPPFDIGDQGRMSFLQDPQGARFTLWQARAHIGAGLVNCAGAMVWNELHTPDRAASQQFYGALFGWQFVAHDDESDEIRNGGRANGGLRHTAGAAHWRVYFAVADMDEAAARLPELGGEALTPIEQPDAQSRRLLIRDPAGAECGLLQLAQPDAWEEAG